MANPAFSNSPAFSAKAAQRLAARDAAAAPAVPTPGQLQEHYSLPDATPDQMERMTYQDTIFKTLAGFAVLLVGAAIGWMIPALAIVGAIVGLVLALVNIFKRKPSPPLILAYAFVEGLLVGGVSYFFSTMWNGIVPMALLGTLGVVAVTLALFASGKVRASKRATKIFLVAIVGYAAFSLVNLVLMMTGVLDGFSATGESGVETGQPRIYGWTAAFGIIVTVVWLYLEILRLLSYFLPRN
jgi:uncharacterized YccA/Bax inhibitor family protein